MLWKIPYKSQVDGDLAVGEDLADDIPKAH